MPTSGKILVTGAGGFIGTRLVHALAQGGNQVRALTRSTNLEAPPGLGWPKEWPASDPRIELVRGDITDAASILQAMEGCSQVYHMAAYAKNWSANANMPFLANVQGMRNVFDAAEKVGVERVVLTSTIVSFGPTHPGEVRDESMPRITETFFTEYEATKAEAEQEAMARAREGFPVVIVNPTRVYGPGHLTESSVSVLIDLYDRGKVPIQLNRGLNVANYVLVEDVVQGHLLAMEKGRIGERYILGGENASLKQFFQVIDEVSGKRHFQFSLPSSAARLFALLQEKRAEWLGIYPQITPGWVETFLLDWAYTSQKAERELGYQPTQLAEGIRRTYEWLQHIRKP